MNQNQLLREQFNVFGQQMDPNLMLTLTTNQSWDAAKMKRLVGKFFGRVDRKLLGAAWLERPIAERIDGVAFVEKPTVNVHAHCVVNIDKKRVLTALKMVRPIWQSLCPSGEVDFSVVTYSYAATDYCLKETERKNYKFDDQIIILREFHPQ